MKDLTNMLNLPIIELTEKDEKCLFDLGVQLKFSNASKISHMLITIMP